MEPNAAVADHAATGKRNVSGRVLSAVFLGIMFGLYRHVEQANYLQLGRDAYLAVQSRHFEKMSEYPSVGYMLLACVLLAAAVFGLYELIAAGIARVLPPSTAEE
jgi:hypothetical protein